MNTVSQIWRLGLFTDALIVVSAGQLPNIFFEVFSGEIESGGI